MCIICEEHETFGDAVCKVCGMYTKKPIIYNSFFFCSEKCAEFFIDIRNKSPDLVNREIIF